MQSSLPANELVTDAAAATEPGLDQNLRRGILHTEVARPVAWLLVASFLLAIFALPLGQAYLEKREDEASPLLDLFKRAPTAANLKQVEHDIEEACYAKAFVQPRLQLWLTRLGRVGNKRAVVGHGGWLYYTPGVLHVGGPGFLDPAFQRQRELDAVDEPIRADPRPAILGFHRALAERGIRLVLMPIPDKAAIEGVQLHGRGAPGTLPDNPDSERFLAELRTQGVAVFDARAVLTSAPRPAYLVTDTHWTPATMERVARELAAFINGLGVLRRTEPASYHSVEQSAERVGDLVDMLKLPDDQAAFPPQSVLIHQVQDSKDQAWEPEASADVLLLGDSFTNVFSLEGMGWGAAAGLAPHLALALQRPLDVIAQNDSGAFATRQALSNELGAGNDRLANKRVVIWEFAARELSVGDWKRLQLPQPQAAGGN